MISTRSSNYEPSLRSSIASHGNQDLFISDQPSVLGLELSSDTTYKGPFSTATWNSEPTIQHSPSVTSFADKESLASARSSERLVDSATSSYFDPRPELPSLPACSLPPNLLPRSTRERNLKRLSQDGVPQYIANETPSRPSSRASIHSSRPPSSRASSYRRAPSRPRSLAEEIRDVGEEVPRSDLDDSDDDVSWAAVLGGPPDIDRFISRSSEQSFERQRAAFPPPRSRTSSISNRSIVSQYIPSRTSSFSAKPSFSAKSPITTPPLTPDPARPKASYGPRHSFHIEQLSAGSPSASLAPPSPLDDRGVSPRRSNSISGLASFHPLRSFRNTRRGSGKGKPEVANINVPNILTAADLPSPVPELPNEGEPPTTFASANGKGSAPSSTHSRDSAVFYPRLGLGMAPATPTRPSGKPRISLPKMPKVFRRSSSSHQNLAAIEATEELAPDAENERSYSRRPSAGSRRSYSSRMSTTSQISHPSANGSTPATPGTPDHLVENSPLQYVVNVNTNANSRPVTPPPAARGDRKDAKEIKPIMIVDYTSYPGSTYHPPSPQKVTTPGSTPSRPTAPGPPVRSQPSTPAITVSQDSGSPAKPPATPSPPARVPPKIAKTAPPSPKDVQMVVAVPPQMVMNVPIPAPAPAPAPAPVAVAPTPAPAATVAPPASAPPSPSPTPKVHVPHLSVGSNASIDMATALSECPISGTPAFSSEPIPMPDLADIELAAEPAAPATPVVAEMRETAPVSTPVIVPTPAMAAGASVPIAASGPVAEPKAEPVPVPKAAVEPQAVEISLAAPKTAEPAVAATPKAKPAAPLPAPASPEPAPKAAVEINIDAKKASVEIVPNPAAPETAGETTAPVTPPPTTPKLLQMEFPRTKTPKTPRSPKSPKHKSAPISTPKSNPELLPSRSRSPSLSSIDARVSRSLDGSQDVWVSIKSHRGSTTDLSDFSDDKLSAKSSSKAEIRQASFAQFDKQPKTPVTPEKQRIRPEHIKHHSVDSIRRRDPHYSHHLQHSKHHSLDAPRYTRSVSYDHTYAPSHLRGDISRSRSSRRNSLESNASFATIDSSGVARKRRVLNPMNVDASDSGSDGDASDTEGEGDNIAIEYNESDDAVNVTVKARTLKKHDSGVESGDESALEREEARDDGRKELRRRIQAAQRLMQENPRLPSEIDDVPATSSFPAGPMPHVPPQHWPRPAPHPALRPLYLGGRAFGAPVSTGMMPGLGYAAGQLGGGTYLGMPMAAVPMMLGRPPAAQPGWYPRPRP